MVSYKSTSYFDQGIFRYSMSLPKQCKSRNRDITLAMTSRYINSGDAMYAFWYLFLYHCDKKCQLNALLLKITGQKQKKNKKSPSSK